MATMEQVVAEALADGGPVEDEMGAANAVLQVIAEQDWRSFFRHAMAEACSRGGARRPTECADIAAACLVAALRPEVHV